MPNRTDFAHIRGGGSARRGGGGEGPGGSLWGIWGGRNTFLLSGPKFPLTESGFHLRKTKGQQLKGKIVS